ncbi:MAG: ABC transporter permease [Planctomycetota bacterium]
MNQALIQIDDLWKTYTMGSLEVHALRGVHVTIARAEYVAIIGPSGSGKSTLMNLIGCLDTPSRGRYLLNGKLVSEMADDELARIRNQEIGFVFQTFNLLARADALHNVELPLIYRGMPAEERQERAREALREVELEQRMHHRPNELSGGQRQRVAIARALVTRPSILLADEPTGNLDSKTSIEIMDLFDRLHGAGNTIILVTHERDIAARAKRVLTLKDGLIERDELVSAPRWSARAMSIGEALKIALMSLVANPLRSFLTLLGIIIGITSIIAVVSIINGLNLYVQEKLSDLGPGVFVVSRLGIITNRQEFLTALRKNKPLRLADARAIRERCPQADVVACETHANANVAYRGNSVEGVDVSGIHAEILEIEPYDVEIGRILLDVEVDRAAAVAFIGWEIADKLFPNVDPRGKQVRIRGKDFEVVGVAKKKGSVFGMSRDNFVRIPITTFQKMFGARGSVNISVKAADKTNLDATIDQVRVVLRAKHHLHYDDPDDFGITSAEGINTLWANLTRIIFNVAIFIVGLSLVVGGIVIMNIMLVAVIERTREIGVRKAVGARQRDIRRQFLIESVVLSCCGGLIGVSFAYLISWTLRTFTPLPAAFPVWAPVLSFVICAAIGIFFGLQPAAKAARLDPIEALRAE